MNAQLNHIAAQQRNADLFQLAEHKRTARMATRNSTPRRRSRRRIGCVSRRRELLVDPSQS
jgi:hypothetical protein